MEHIFSVRDINKYIKVALESNRDLQGIFIRGEVSNCKYHSSGHLYFTLKDGDSQIPAVMWRERVQSQMFKIADGSKIIAEGSVAVYERGGSYQFNLYSYTDDGVGNLYLAFEELKTRLMAEGLFETAAKKEIPSSAKKIALITSETGSVVHDFITVTKRRNAHAKVVIIPTPMQGMDAAPHIINSINAAHDIDDVDLIILARGGGSFEDLNVFNSEAVARAIFKSTLPIISAIGHETDVTIADFVADLRAATPSVAAELASPNMSNAKEYLKSVYGKIIRSIFYKFDEASLKLNNVNDKRVLKNPLSVLLHPKEQAVDATVDRIKYAASSLLLRQTKKYELTNTKISVLNPLAVMERGFTYITDNNGNIIKRAKSTDGVNNFIINFSDGKISVKK